MRALLLVLLFGIACLAGLVTSEILWRSSDCRALIDRLSGQVGEGAAAGENLRLAAHGEIVADEAVQREMDLLRDQFGSEGAFEKALDSAKLPRAALRLDVVEHLRARQWIEKQIAPALQVSQEECRHFYAANREQFMQPQRFRAAHIFLAAPDDSPPEFMALKQHEIDALGVRLAKGESLAALAAEASEDEATKHIGGDLGYFAANRMPREFIAEVLKLRRGQISQSIRTHLGFHLVLVTEIKPARELPLEEARPEIAAHLRNDKRALAVARRTEALRRGE